MNDDTNWADVAIVGAGICGLMAAAVLATRNLDVVLLDKGRSVGGRLATRRVGAGRADHGAQFFTVRSPLFGEWVQRWVGLGLVYPWSTGWSDGSLATTAPDGHPRYAVRDGMNALAKHLAAQVENAGATMRTGVRVTAVTPADPGAGAAEAGWILTADDGSRTAARAVVLTAPAPQSLAMLDAGDTRLTDGDRASLAAIQYAPCLCGLFTVRGGVHLPAPGAVQQPDAAITWIADNQPKAISPAETVITVHAGPGWSAARYDEPDSAVQPELAAALGAWLDSGAKITAGEVKRWRYAVPITLHAERLLRAGGAAPLYFGGDGFGGPRVEGAVLSGLAIGQALASELA